MIKAQQIVDLLNEAAKLDPGAIHLLCANHVPCNKALGDHPTIPVSAMQEKYFSVGMLGILNGIAAMDGEVIEMLFDQREKGAHQFNGFRLRPPKPMCEE